MQLQQPNESWFQQVLVAFGLKDVCRIVFAHIDHGHLSCLS